MGSKVCFEDMCPWHAEEFHETSGTTVRYAITGWESINEGTRWTGAPSSNVILPPWMAYITIATVGTILVHCLGHRCTVHVGVH